MGKDLRAEEAKGLGLGSRPVALDRLVRRFVHLVGSADEGAPAAAGLRRQRKAALLRMNARFAAAIDKLRQGLVILDHDLQVLVCNHRLHELFPAAAPALVAGERLPDIIATAGCRLECGAGHPECDMRRCFSAGSAFTCRHALPTGRIILARWHRLPDLCWVGTFEDITEQHQSTARIAHLARHDDLTDLINRAGFSEAVARAAGAARRGETFAVLAIRLDRFSKVIESFGHDIGDALLREAATRLRRSVRDVDEVGRLGCEEFTVLQTKVDQPEGAESLARRVIEILALPYSIEGNEVSVGISIGIALGDADSTDAETILRNASLALAEAAVDGERPNRSGFYRIFAAAMGEAAKARRAIEADLRHALERNELELFYQPLINIGARRVSGFEALLRWRHPVKGLIPPDAFIPLAEESGLIVPIGEWVLRTACAEAMRWDTPDGGAPLRVAVNLSAVQFASPGLPDIVEDALTWSGLPGERLELEVTESVLLQDNAATLETLHRLRGLGARISMDDFGTGYSSLSYLRSFPFDKIKIDKSFIQGLSQSGESEAIVRAIAGLGISLGIATTAEGVETYDQLERLIADGCTEVQGYFFSPPRPAAEVPGLILTAPARQVA